jgi:hypothetical protein
MENVVRNKPLIRAGEEKVGQAIAMNIPVDGPARIEAESEIEVVDRPVTNNKLDLLKFMEEQVTVVVHRTADKMATPVPEVWVNGVVQRFVRGQKQVVKRKFVEALARARDLQYEQEVGVDRNTGEAMNRMVPVVGLKYPFDVLEDSNPKGRAWVQSLLQEA